MKITPTAIPEVLILEPVVHRDARGFFLESYRQERFEAAVGHRIEFVQDNHSRSVKNVLRGLHYQVPPRAQGKLVRVVRGAVFDVAVDLRTSSPSFGHWIGTIVSEENQRQVWIPEGFAHGFLVLSEQADVLYKTTDYYDPAYERTLRWDDETLAIRWPLAGVPRVSEKDRRARSLQEAELFEG